MKKIITTITALIYLLINISYSQTYCDIEYQEHPYISIVLQDSNEVDIDSTILYFNHISNSYNTLHDCPYDTNSLIYHMLGGTPISIKGYKKTFPMVLPWTEYGISISKSIEVIIPYNGKFYLNINTNINKSIIYLRNVINDEFYNKHTIYEISTSDTFYNHNLGEYVHPVQLICLDNQVNTVNYCDNDSFLLYPTIHTKMFGVNLFDSFYIKNDTLITTTVPEINFYPGYTLYKGNYEIGFTLFGDTTIYKHSINNAGIENYLPIINLDTLILEENYILLQDNYYYRSFYTPTFSINESLWNVNDTISYEINDTVFFIGLDTINRCLMKKYLTLDDITSITNTTTDKQIKSVTYYDLLGRVICYTLDCNELKRNIVYIKLIEYNDNTFKTNKFTITK